MHRRNDLSQSDPRAERYPKGTLRQSFSCALAGIQYVLRSERNARIHLAIALPVVILGLWLQLSAIEWGLIITAIAFVFSSEMLNTVVELVVDLVTLDHHPLAKQAKDVAAGAVLVAAFAAAVIGLLILVPPLIGKLGSL